MLSFMDLWNWLLQDIMEAKSMSVFKQRISPWVISSINLKTHKELMA